MSRRERIHTAEPGAAGQISPLLVEYHEALSILASDHDRDLGQIAVSHAASIEQLSGLDESRTQSFGNILRATSTLVDTRIRLSAGDLNSYLGQASQEFNLVLNPDDRSVLSAAESKATVYGRDSSELAEALKGASSRLAGSAIRAALDKDLWKLAQTKATLYGVGSDELISVLKTASSEEVVRAIKAALDKEVWAAAQTKATLYGVGSDELVRVLRSASSKSVRSAIRTALDKEVWAAAQTKATLYGVGSDELSSVIDEASSTISGALMTKLLVEKGSPSGRSSARRQRKAGPRPNFGQRTGTHQRSQRAEPPRTEAQTQANINDELDQILARVVRIGDGNSWLHSEDRNNIKRVVSTVRAIRQRAQQEGRDISDKEIYLRYRRKVDVPVGAEKPEDLMRSFLILQALMGGKPSGKLPF